jgi:hypothetical protein
MGQKWAKNGPKIGQKRAKNASKYIKNGPKMGPNLVRVSTKIHSFTTDVITRRICLQLIGGGPVTQGLLISETQSSTLPTAVEW